MCRLTHGRGLGVVLALSLFSCAHAAPAPESEVEAAPVEKILQLSAEVTAPVRQTCRLKGPHLAARDRLSGSLVVNYQVSAEGKVSDVAVQGDATDGAIRAVRRYLESCKYAPATRNGKPVSVSWKGELSFPTRAPGPR